MLVNANSTIEQIMLHYCLKELRWEKPFWQIIVVIENTCINQPKGHLVGTR